MRNASRRSFCNQNTQVVIEATIHFSVGIRIYITYLHSCYRGYVNSTNFELGRKFQLDGNIIIGKQNMAAVFVFWGVRNVI